MLHLIGCVDSGMKHEFRSFALQFDVFPFGDLWKE
jgi:hypothetical protein